MPSPLDEKIWIGTAGWSYPDWKGFVYPAFHPRAAHELETLSQYFDTVEINTSFYRPLRAEISSVWLRRVSSHPRFQFTAKLYKRFTHERDAGRTDERDFKEGISPLMQAGKLGALLLQFPWSFKNTPEQREYLSGLLVQFREYPLVVEVRHASWNRPDVLKFLQDHRAGFCNVDQPLIGRSMPATQNVTAPIGYVRLHGRNYETWFAEDSGAELRYDYLYSRAELLEWKQRLEAIAARSERTYVVLNNHYQGKAVVNALQLASMVYGKPLEAPPPLLERYPQLEECSSTPAPQSHLFRCLII